MADERTPARRTRRRTRTWDEPAPPAGVPSVAPGFGRIRAVVDLHERFPDLGFRPPAADVDEPDAAPVAPRPVVVGDAVRQPVERFTDRTDFGPGDVGVADPPDPVDVDALDAAVDYLD